VGLAYVDIALAQAMYKRADSSHVGQKLTLQETMVFEHHNILSKIRI